MKLIVFPQYAKLVSFIRVKGDGGDYVIIRGMDAKRKIPYVAMNWVKLAGEFVVVALSAAMAFAAGAAPLRLDLSGEWDVRGTNFAGRVHLPGTLADAGLGTLQTPAHFAAYTERTEKTGLALKYKYRGKAVYSRTFSLAKEHAAKPLEVFLERVMWSSRLKIDGRDYGLCDSLGAPHVHRVHAGALAPGVHRIEIEIDNSKHYGVAMKAHGYGEWMQSVWHGAIGRLEIREANPLDSVRVFASFPAGKKVRFELPEGFAANAETVVSDSLKFSGFVTERSPYAEGRVMVTASLSEEPQPWDEFNPRLYDVTFRGAEGSFGKTIRFGFRTIGREGNRFMLNGRPLFVRADIDNCHFPLTGYPDMTRREWDRFFAIQRNNGMNAIQMHTWTPPEAAFEAADEAGMMIFCELGYWNENGVTTSCAGHGNAALDDWLRRELRAIADAYGNHPSMVSDTFGNELGFCNFMALDKWMSEHKKYDPRRLTMCSTARQVAPSDDFMVTHNYPHVGATRGKYAGGADYDYEDVFSKTPIPTIAHEIGQWPVYPMWDEEIGKFSGLLVPWRWRSMREAAVSNNTFRFAREFNSASMLTSRHFYKLETEGLLRTASCNGIEYLQMRDYTGQGEALTGWYDAFFGAKPALGEVPPFSSFNAPLVCLAKFAKFVWTDGELFKARLLVRNMLSEDIPAGTCWRWSLGHRSGWAVAEKPIPAGTLADVGGVEIPLEQFGSPRRLELRFGENSWRIYVLPTVAEIPAAPRNVLVTADPAAAKKALAEGGRVVYTGGSGKGGLTAFKPIYWSTGLFPAVHKHIGFGAVVDSSHPALAPTGCDRWQDEFWRRLFEDGDRKATAHRLEGMPRDFRPIVTVVPDLHHSYFISPLFEVKVGEGRLLVCGLNIDSSCPAARFLKRTLWRYAGSEDFAPRWSVEPCWFDAMFPAGGGKAANDSVKLDADTQDMLNVVKPRP